MANKKQSFENVLGKVYPILRIFVFLIPVIAIFVGVYLILFPIEDYKYYSSNPELSKFEIAGNTNGNSLEFGIFPLREHPYVDLYLQLKNSTGSACLTGPPKIEAEKTYRAFLYPEGDPITDAEKLREIVFSDNNSDIPNGSLLHLKPTNEVFFVSHGKRILFPGPDIFLAYGYSFDNLVEVDKSALDQFPEADKKILLWNQPHPDGTIFQAYLSHNLYVVFDGQKHLIAGKEILDRVWKNNYSIPVGDLDPANRMSCDLKDFDPGSRSLNCRFDTRRLAANLGKYYNFTVAFPEKCSAGSASVQYAKIDFVAEKSYATVKDSLRNIFASILNRYIYQRYH